MREERGDKIESLKKEFPEVESILRLERVPLKERPVKGGAQPRILKILSILMAGFLSSSIAFLLSRWLEHPLIVESGFLRDLSKGRFLLYLLPLFFMITSILSLIFSNLLLRTNWRKVRKEEELSYKRLILSLASENPALSEKWRIKVVHWSLRLRKTCYLIPWRLFLPLIVLALVLLFLRLFMPTAIPGQLITGLLYGKSEKTQLDLTLRFLEPKIDLMFKSFFDDLIRKIDLLLRW